MGLGSGAVVVSGEMGRGDDETGRREQDDEEEEDEDDIVDVDTTVKIVAFVRQMTDDVRKAVSCVVFRLFRIFDYLIS